MSRSRRRPPVLVVVAAAFTVLFFAIPLVGILQRADWSTVWDDLTTEQSRDALRLSLICSLSAAGLSVLFGTPLAWVLARTHVPGRPFIRGLVLLPMVLPPVVGGVALLAAFSLRSPIGGWLHDAFGIQFTFSTAGAIMAETFVAMPFYVITVEAALRSMNQRYEDAAASLGANRFTVFRRVTLPLIAPSVAAGAVLAWARALGEFGATITFAGNIAGRTQTLPLAVYLELESDQEAAIALSLVLLVVSLVVLVSLRDRWLTRGMTLHAAFSLRLGDLDLDVDVRAPSGAVLAVLGPNGAGKTTLLRAVAGSVAVDTGSITLDDTVLDQPPDVFVPQERRRLGIVHQDYLLFPHLSALDNVAFGPRSQGRTARAARTVAVDLLDRVGITTNADAKPRALSGGQAQRVALARALATGPAALLLDEPLAALDAGTRVEVRRDLRRYLAEFAGPTILVTHDPVDALALADHVAILEAGRVTQTGTIAEVTTRPRSRYVADLIGTNLVHGTASGTTITTEHGADLTTAEPHDGDVFATIAPAAVALHRHEPEGSPRNRWPTTVAHLDLLGDRVRVRLAAPLELVAEVTPAAVADLDLGEGDPIWVSVKATEITTYPR